MIKKEDSLEDYHYYIERDKWEAKRQAYVDDVLRHIPGLGKENHIYGFCLNEFGQQSIQKVLLEIREALNDLEKLVCAKVKENEKLEMEHRK